MEGSTLERLKALHAVDVEIADVGRQIREAPLRLADDRAAVERAHAAVEALKKEIVETSAKADRKDLDIRSKEGEIGKLEVARNSVKTNADYERLTVQIQSAKADISRLEEEALGHIARADEMKAMRKSQEKELAAVEAEFRTLEAEVDREVEGLKSRLAGLQERRAKALDGIPPDALSKYERIASGKGGIAMAAVRDQVCQGCHMSVTTHDITRILRESDLVLCRTCSRILYLEDRRRV